MPAVKESGRARARRLLRESRCKCGEPGVVSIPVPGGDSRSGSPKHQHYCQHHFDLRYGYTPSR